MRTDSTFHLVISTVRGPEHLARCLSTLEHEPESLFVTVVEQHEDQRCRSLVEPFIAAGRGEYVHEPVVRGVSRGRNRGMRQLRGRYVAFPDDDCWYPEGTLTAVREQFDRTHDGQHVDGIAATIATPEGDKGLLRWLSTTTWVRPRTIPRTVSAASLFFRADVVAVVGEFDPELGTGCATPFGAGEEADYVQRALDHGYRMLYRADLAVYHREWRDDPDVDAVRAKVRRYNRGFARALRKHRQFGHLAYWVARSVVGVGATTLRRDRPGRDHQLDQLVGRLQGWFSGPVPR
ncbi:glycosyltransferase family 2 protein [Curtobacterium sp. PhB115]|uniref:glycosyltransferase family 2 protein n=1 Tax=Curtobacterium sp. PhB115 TaxID=2485173 RepID=UPI000F4C9BCE|nr:glycosyltransferase [Curtobacterium sp. PhB115]ROP74848.1 GT2 family glycosyltransferase [Curtobacterium sp. PhB115]